MSRDLAHRLPLPRPCSLARGVLAMWKDAHVTRLRYFTAGFIVGMFILVSFTSKAHRLNGHPRTLERKLQLAKAQVQHDQAVITHATQADGWMLISAWPFTALDHRRWLTRDLAYVRQLTRQLNPRLAVDACLRAIIDRENPGWDPLRYNTAGSGAYGLPQALPGWKMASAGPDWRTNPWTQIRWMIGYVNERYGGSCAAWAYWQAHGSY